MSAWSSIQELIPQTILMYSLEKLQQISVLIAVSAEPDSYQLHIVYIAECSALILLNPAACIVWMLISNIYPVSVFTIYSLMKIAFIRQWIAVWKSTAALSVKHDWYLVISINISRLCWSRGVQYNHTNWHEDLIWLNLSIKQGKFMMFQLWLMYCSFQYSHCLLLHLFY